MKLRYLFSLPLLFAVACNAPAETSSSGATANEPIASCPAQLRFAVTDIPGEERLQEEFGAFQTALGEVLAFRLNSFQSARMSPQRQP